MNYTTYFSYSNMAKEAGITPISISLWPPRGWRGAKYPKLAPSKSILSDYKQDNEWPKYAKRYHEEILGKLNATKVYEDLCFLSENKPFALCCFEKNNAKCHRKLVSEWLNKELHNKNGWVDIVEFV